MEFGLEKCAEIAFKRGKLVHSQNLVTDINREIQEVEGNTYRYLGIEESEGIQHQQMKERLKQTGIHTAIEALAARVEIQFWYN